MATKNIGFRCPEHGSLSAPVEYFSVDIGSKRLVDVPVKFCNDCRKYYTPFINLLALVKLQYKGYQVSATTVGGGSKETVRVPYFIDIQPDNKPAETKNKQKKARNRTLPAASHKTPKYIHGYNVILLKHIYLGGCKEDFTLTNYPCDECLCCKKKLTNFVNFARLNETEGVKISGQYCSACDIFYENRGSTFKKLLKSLPDKDKFAIHEQFLIPDYTQKIQYARSKKSASLAIHLKHKTSNVHRLVTIVASRSDKDYDSDIFHYSDLLARQLLYSVYKDEKNTWMYGEEYDLLKVLSFDRKNNDMVNRLKVKKIVLRKGGGLYQGILEDNVELVDILLYSPFTGCLEIAHASYDSEHNLYYMDVKVFRDFVAQYGNPGITLAAYQKGKVDFSTMREESILHAYGYVVGNSGLPDKAREILLAEVLDLGIMSTYSIIRLLDLNIATHSAEKYLLARADWELDRQFVMGYEIKPERFVVATIGL